MKLYQQVKSVAHHDVLLQQAPTLEEMYKVVQIQQLVIAGAYLVPQDDQLQLTSQQVITLFGELTADIYPFFLCWENDPDCYDSAHYQSTDLWRDLLEMPSLDQTDEVLQWSLVPTPYDIVKRCRLATEEDPDIDMGQFLARSAQWAYFYSRSVQNDIDHWMAFYYGPY